MNIVYTVVYPKLHVVTLIVCSQEVFTVAQSGIVIQPTWIFQKLPNIVYSDICGSELRVLLHMFLCHHHVRFFKILEQNTYSSTRK